MYECVCVRTCVYVCVCACVCVCARARARMCGFACNVDLGYAHVPTSTLCACKCLRTCMCVCTCVCAHARACVRMHARACAKLGVEGGGGGAHGAGSVLLYSLVSARTVWQWLYSTGGACECTFVNRI